MKATEGRIGRVFVIRLEDGDVVPGCIERFADEKGISVGHVILVGGIGDGKVVVGPRRSDERPPEPMYLPVDGAHEVVGVGVLARLTGAVRADHDWLPATRRQDLAGRRGYPVRNCWCGRGACAGQGEQL